VSGAISRDGRVFVTGANDGVVRVWHMRKDGPRGQRRLILQEALCAHTGGVTCLAICQTYGIVVSGSEDKTVVLWDLNTLRFVRQLAELQNAITTVHVDDLTGEIVTGAGGSLCVWSINGDCLAAHGEQGDTCQAGEEVLSVTTPQFSDHVLETNLYISGHADGSIKLWGLEHRVVAAQIEQGARKVSRERRSLSLNVSALQQAAHAVAAVDKPPTFTDLATSSLQSPQPPPSPSLTIEDLLKDHIMNPVSEESEALPEEDHFEIGRPPGLLIHPRRRTSDGEPKQGFSPRTPRLHGGPEYRLVLKKVLTWHTVGVTALCVSPSLKQVFSGDRDGRVACWSLPEDGLRDHFQEDSTVVACSNCKRKFALVERRHHCCNCGRVLCSKCCSRKVPLEDLGYFTPVRVCQDCYELRVRGTSKVEGPLLAAQALIPKPTPKPEAVEGAPKRSKSPKKHSMLEKIGSTRW
jgi:WD40 repeat protein